MKLTQRQRLLNAFETKGELYVYEIMQPQPHGLGIAQYNARIKELREQGHQIINKEPGHFVYKRDSAEREKPMGSGYKQFQKMGQFLKNQSQKPVANPYRSQPITKLEELKATAEAWLESHSDHPHYPEALSRYECICDALIEASIVGEPDINSSHTEQKLI